MNNETNLLDLLDEILESPTLDEIERNGAVLKTAERFCTDFNYCVTLYLYKQKKYVIVYKCDNYNNRECIMFREYHSKNDDS